MDGMKQSGGGNPSLVLEGTAGSASAGGCSEADLQRGYCDCQETMDERGAPLQGDSLVFADSPEPAEGFLDRPMGWER